MNSKPNPRRVNRAAHLGWVPIGMMRVSPDAQRDFKQWRVNEIVADFDLDQIGILVVSRRDGFYWIIDGQHRVKALEAIGYGDQQVQCDIYEGLTEADEAEMFLRRNNQLTVTAFAKFRVGVTAGRPEECAINAVVQAAGLKVSASKGIGTVSAVAALRNVYRRDGEDGLRRALAIIRNAYGDTGLQSIVIDGIGMLVHRYGDLEDAYVVRRFRAAPGGVGGLMNRADVLKRSTGYPRAQCIAAAAVNVINGGRGGKKIPSWWRSEDAA